MFPNKNPPDPQPDDLLSPFLQDELFFQETEQEAESDWNSSFPAVRHESPFALAFEERLEMTEEPELFEAGLGEEFEAAWSPEAYAPALEGETDAGLRQKLRYLSLLPHRVEQAGTDKELAPGLMDPGIYDGPVKYKIADSLQQRLMAVMNARRDFQQIKIALVDLTKGPAAPEMAAYNHKSQVFAASVPKIAAMLAAYQLRHDLRRALASKAPASLQALYDQVRSDWAATQANPGGTPTAFTQNITLRGKLVLVRGSLIPLQEPKAPRLEQIFAPVPGGGALRVEFTSTGESKSALTTIIEDFNKSKAGARAKLDALGFLERLRVMVGGMVPASNYATATIVRDVGFPYIASTLLQTGLYSTDRSGGLWLGADYWGKSWRGALGGGPAQSATAGSLAAFMTLLAQGRLVSPQASREMRDLMKKEPNSTHPGIVSHFKEGLKRIPSGPLFKLVLSKLGAHSGVDDCAYIEREIDLGGGVVRTIKYVAVGLRAANARLLQDLILELDKCILANNGFTAAQGGHSELEIAFEAEGFADDFLPEPAAEAETLGWGERVLLAQAGEAAPESETFTEEWPEAFSASEQGSDALTESESPLLASFEGWAEAEEWALPGELSEAVEAEAYQPGMEETQDSEFDALLAAFDSEAALQEQDEEGAFAEYGPEYEPEFETEEAFEDAGYETAPDLEAGPAGYPVEISGEHSKAVQEALAQQQWAEALKLAIQEGERDENKLANMIFFARHKNMEGVKLDPKQAAHKKLIQEWGKILSGEVRQAIEAAAARPDLAVAGKDAAQYHSQFRGKSGKKFKELVLWAAKETGLNPGLLAANLLAETGRRSSYLTSQKVRSYHVGTDDFYEKRHDLRKKVPAYAKVRWDASQTPVTHLNDRRGTGREVKTILFNSGRDALLASAVYLKHGEIGLRQEATRLGKDFDALPVETRFALTRIAFAGGLGAARKVLAEALSGKDILDRSGKPLKKYQTRRNATIRAAQAIHLSEWIFGVPVAAAAKTAPEIMAEAWEAEGQEFWGPGEAETWDEAEWSDDEFEAEASLTGWEPESDAGEMEAAELLAGAEWVAETELLADDESPEYEFGLSEADFEEEIIQPDTRLIVAKPLDVPYRWICALDLYYENPDYGPNQNKWIVMKGTGVLIGADCVLTAAHALEDEVTGSQGTKKRQPVKRIVVTPARYGDGTPKLGSVEAAKWLPNQHWNPNKTNWQQDFGLIKLKDAIGLKQYAALDNQPLGWWGSAKTGGGTFIKVIDAGFLKGRKVWMAGYPGDKCGKNPASGSLSDAQIARCAQQTPKLWASYPWIASGEVTWIEPKSGQLMQHTIDSYKGQSGAPVWYRYQDRRWLVGIHVAPASPRANFAVRINKTVIAEIQRLMRVL